MHSGDFMLITRSYACVYDSVFVDARVDFRFVEFLSGSIRLSDAAMATLITAVQPPAVALFLDDSRAV